MAFYANRKRTYEEILPWSHLDYSVSEKFLQKEHTKAVTEVTTKNCRQECSSCGANKLVGGACFGQ